MSCDVAADGSVFWPVTLSKQIGPYTLTNLREQDFKTGNYVRRDIAVKVDGKDKMVRQYQICNWLDGEDVPNASDLLNMFQDAGSFVESTRSNSPLLIHCRDAVSQSGLVVMLWILLQKTEVEGEVDVYRTAKYLRHSAPGALPHIEQYKYCYSFLKQKIGCDKFCHQSPAIETRARSRSPRKSGLLPTASPTGRRTKSASPKKRLSSLFTTTSSENNSEDMSKESKDSVNSKKRRSRSLDKSACTRVSHRDVDQATDSSHSYIGMSESPQPSRSAARSREGSSPRSRKTSERRKKRRPVECPPLAPPSALLESCVNTCASLPPPLPSAPPPDVRKSKGRCERRSPCGKKSGLPRPELPEFVPKTSCSDRKQDRQNKAEAAGEDTPTGTKDSQAKQVSEQEGLKPATPIKAISAQPLTPHSKIAKARRDYFGVESPSSKGETRSEMTLTSDNEVKKKLFGEKEAGAGVSSVVCSMYVEDLPDDSAEENDTKYSVEDITSHLQNSANPSRKASEEDFKAVQLVHAPVTGTRTEGSSQVRRTTVEHTCARSETPVNLSRADEHLYENVVTAENSGYEVPVSTQRRCDLVREAKNAASGSAGPCGGYDLVCDPSDHGLDRKYEHRDSKPEENMQRVRAAKEDSAHVYETISTDTNSWESNTSSSKKSETDQSSESLVTTDDGNKNNNVKKKRGKQIKVKQEKDQESRKTPGCAENFSGNCNKIALPSAVGPLESRAVSCENVASTGGCERAGQAQLKAASCGDLDVDSAAIACSSRSRTTDISDCGLSGATKAINRQRDSGRLVTDNWQGGCDHEPNLKAQQLAAAAESRRPQERSQSNENVDELSDFPCVRPGSSYESVVSARGFKASVQNLKPPNLAEKPPFSPKKPLPTSVAVCKTTVPSGSEAVSQRKVPPPTAPKPKLHPKSPGLSNQTA